MKLDAKRHKLLGILTEQRKYVELGKPGYDDLGVSFKIIFEKLKCDEDELHSITSDLYTSGEIEYHDFNVVGLFATDKGVTAFANKKYYNRIIERKKNIVKFVLPILAILISSASLYLSKYSNIGEKQFDKVNKEMQKKIDTLELQVNKLKSKPYNNPILNSNKDSLNVDMK